MITVIGLLLLVLLVIFLFWVTANVIGVVLTLIVAGIVGWLADQLIPGHLPFGWVGAIFAGLVGSWLGTHLFGTIGPRVAGIPIISAFIGAIILAVLFAIVAKATAGRPA